MVMHEISYFAMEKTLGISMLLHESMMRTDANHNGLHTGTDISEITKLDLSGFAKKLLISKSKYTFKVGLISKSTDSCFCSSGRLVVVSWEMITLQNRCTPNDDVGLLLVATLPLPSLSLAGYINSIKYRVSPRPSSLSAKVEQSDQVWIR